MYFQIKYTKESEWKQFVQFLINKMNKNPNDSDIYFIYDELLKGKKHFFKLFICLLIFLIFFLDTAIYIAQIMSIRGLQRILSNESIPALQKYIDISSQVVHADYIKTMIIGTGQHLLSTINF